MKTTPSAFCHAPVGRVAPMTPRRAWRRSALALAATLCLAAGTAPAAAAPRIWDGGGTTDNWSNASNWDGNTDIANNATLVFAGRPGSRA